MEVGRSRRLQVVLVFQSKGVVSGKDGALVLLWGHLENLHVECL